MIRPATESDIPAILSLLRELADYEKLSHACIATEAGFRTHLFGPNPAAEAMVAVVDNHTVGYALWFRTFSTFLAKPGIYLEDVYVQPAHRGKGIGKSFLKHLATLAIARNYGRVEWSVLKWNAPSIAFYKSIGALPLEEWEMMRLTGDALKHFAAS
ncbi:MAG: GNAT family N-acetyltransferase [Phycisphaerae bacterium]